MYQKGAQTGAASLLGKFRDETGDMLTPSHSKKGNRRHRYYVSNRLVSGKPDPSGWRLPAKAFEAAVSTAVVEHLTAAANRHEVLVTEDLAELNEAAERTRRLASRIEQNGAGAAASLIDNGNLGKGCIQINLFPQALSQALEHSPSKLNSSLLHIKAPFHCRRRGAELKIIAGTVSPMPDKAMIRALRNAHAWVGQMKAGSSIREVVARAKKSESYVSRIILLAFLSPRIQKAIMDGTQPLSLTLETLVKSRIPRGWNDQETLFGFGPNS